MVPLAALLWGPFQNVCRVVRPRLAAAGRETQPWSTPTQMAESPKPTEAMLHGDPGVLRSRIRPFAGLASVQKNWNAVRSRLSRMAPGVWGRAMGATARGRKREAG